MARRLSSFGLFGMFGRSADLRQFDDALRAVDLHPKLVPEAVKLTAVNLLKDQAFGGDPAPQVYAPAAAIVAYCMVGAEAFAHANGAEVTQQVEERIDAALRAEDSLDAKLVLLTLHAKVIQPSVIEQFGLAAG